MLEAANPVARIDETTYPSLQEALNAVKKEGDTTVELLADVNLTDQKWTSVDVNGSETTGIGTVTLNGNNHTITGLNAPLFGKVGTGSSGIVIKNLTLDEANITLDENDTTGNTGVGAFIGYAGAADPVTLENCKLTNSNVKGGHWAGGLIGYTAGFSEIGNGERASHVTLTNCSVSNSSVTSKGSVGGLIGHSGGDAWTYTTITGCTVTGCTLTSNSTSDWRVGDLIGTAGVGQTTVDQGTVNSTSGNARSQNGMADPKFENGLVGRAVLWDTGILIVAGRVHAKENTVAIVKGSDGMVKSQHASLNDAVTAALDKETVMLVTDVTLSGTVTVDKSITIDGDGKTITGVSTAQVGFFHVGQATTSPISVTIEDCVFNVEASTRDWHVGIYVQNQVNGLTIRNNTFNISAVKAGGSFQCIGLDYNTNRVTKNVTITGNTVNDTHTGTGGTEFVVAGQKNDQAYLESYSTQTLKITDNKLNGGTAKKLTGVSVSHVDGLEVTNNRFDNCYIGLLLNSCATNGTSNPFQLANKINEIIDGNDDYGTTTCVLALTGAAPLAEGTETITLWDVAYGRVYLDEDAETKLSKIGFDAGDGKFANPETQYVTYVAFDDTEITLPTAPTRDGYTFTGWKAMPEGQAPVTLNASDTTYKAKDSLAFVAQWEKIPETYTVTYTDGVDGVEIFKDQTYTVESGKATPAFSGTPTREGYKFTGWSPAVTDTVTGDATYTAQWERAETPPTSYENLNLACLVTVSCKTAPKQHVSAISRLLEDSYTVTTPVLKGGVWTCTLTVKAGKYVDAFSKLYGKHTLDDAASKDITLIWKNKKNNQCWWAATDAETSVTFNVKCELYTVTYTDGVSGKEVFEDVVYEDLAYGVKTPDFGTKNPTRKGYTFAGWTPKVADTVTKNVTYTAQWEQVTTPPTDKPTAPTHEQLPAIEVKVECGTAHEAHADLTWKKLLTDSYDVGVVERTGDSYTCTLTVKAGKYVEQYNDRGYGKHALDDDATKDITLTWDGQKWTTGTASVTFNVKCELYTVIYTDGVSGKEVFEDVVYGGLAYGVKTPDFGTKNPTRKGYTFAGWTPKVADTVTKNVTYTATWKSNSGKDNVPKTGDGELVMVLGSVLLFSFCGAAAVCVCGRKRRQG